MLIVFIYPDLDYHGEQWKKCENGRWKVKIGLAKECNGLYVGLAASQPRSEVINAETIAQLDSR